MSTARNVLRFVEDAPKSADRWSMRRQRKRDRWSGGCRNDAAPSIGMTVAAATQPSRPSRTISEISTRVTGTPVDCLIEVLRFATELQRTINVRLYGQALPIGYLLPCHTVRPVSNRRKFGVAVAAYRNRGDGEEMMKPLFIKCGNYKVRYYYDAMALGIEFQSGAEFIYRGVPSDVYKTIIDSGSIAKFIIELESNYTVERMN